MPKQSLPCHRILLLSIAGLFMFPLFATAGPRSAPFKLLTRHADKCIDLKGRKTHNGNAIHQWGCKRDVKVRDNKLWVLEKIGGGRVVFHNQKTRRNGTSSVIDMAQSKNRGRVVLYRRHYKKNQQWTLEYRGKSGGRTWYAIRSVQNPNLCLDIAGASKGNGARLQVYRCVRVPQQEFALYIPRSHRMSNFIKGLGKKISSGAKVMAKKAASKTMTAFKQAHRVSRRTARKLENFSKKISKQAGQISKQALDKALKEATKYSNKAKNGITSATKKALKAAQKAYNATKNHLKKRLMDYAKKFFEMMRSEIGGKIEDRMKEAIEGKFLRKLTRKIEREANKFKRDMKRRTRYIKQANPRKARSLRGKFGLRKMKLKSRFKRMMNPKYLKRNLKRSAKSTLPAKVAAIAAELGLVFAWSATECAVRGHTKGCQFKECFAYKSAEGMFDYVYGIPIGLVADPIIAGLGGQCMFALSPLVAGTMGLGAPVALFACYVALNDELSKLIDKAIKGRIQSKFWTGGPKWQHKFIKAFGGRPGAYTSNDTVNRRYCPSGRSSGNGGAKCKYNDRSNRSYQVHFTTCVTKNCKRHRVANAGACAAKCRRNRSCKYYFFANFRGKNGCYLLKKGNVYNHSRERDRNNRCSGTR